MALVTPARFASPELIDAASNLLTSWGLDPVVPTQTTLRDRQFGGTDAERAEALEGLVVVDLTQCFKEDSAIE